MFFIDILKYFFIWYSLRALLDPEEQTDFQDLQAHPAPPAQP